MLIAPEDADRILDEIARGDFTKSRVAHDAEIPLLAVYLVLLAETASSLFPKDPPGTCVTHDSLWDFIRSATSYRLMVRTARHIGTCMQCNAYFHESERDV